MHHIGIDALRPDDYRLHEENAFSLNLMLSLLVSERCENPVENVMENRRSEMNKLWHLPAQKLSKVVVGISGPQYVPGQGHRLS